jgi:hypothetical protein
MHGMGEKRGRERERETERQRETETERDYVTLESAISSIHSII